MDETERHNCFHCGNEASAYLLGSFTNQEDYEDSGITTSDTWNLYFCEACKKVIMEVISENSEDYEIDYNGDNIYASHIKILYPGYANNKFKKPSENLPDGLLEDYDEAKMIAGNSPRSAAALLRLLLEKICREFIPNTNGIDLNGMIGKLVAEHAPDYIQKACDIVRVTGNETVHPGVMDVRDTPEIVNLLFELINMIVDYLTMKYKKIDEVYLSLPKNKLDGIAKRDKQNTQSI